MHELSITQGIIDICEKHAGGRHVRSLDVEIGALSGVVPDAIEFSFEACSRGTLLEGARLNIIHVPGRGRCQECGASVHLETIFSACDKCGSNLVTIETGEEMRVKEMEVDDET